MKSNFSVDRDFPVIDGIGHGDKIQWCNVKGGGATNTTLFDPPSSGVHFYPCWRSPIAVSSGANTGSYASCSVNPDVCQGSPSTISDPNCLNAPQIGDSKWARSGDKILLNRIEVNGSIRRPSGLRDSDYTFESVAPKVAVFLYMDLNPDATVVAPTPNPDLVFDDTSGVPGAGNFISGLPWCDINWPFRFRVLAYEVIDFAVGVGVGFNSVILARQVETTGGPLPAVTVSATTSWDIIHMYPELTRGFRFDVDLNDALCSFKSNSGDLLSLASTSLHMAAVLFDGVSIMGFTPVTGNYNFVELQYQSRLTFTDFLSPTSFAPAGVDGPVVAEDADDMAVLADASAGLAGLPALPESPILRPRKKTKASEGYYNFRPKHDDALMHFPDDPEVSRLATPGWRGSGNPSRPKKGRYRGSYPERGSAFDDFVGDDWNDPRRGF